MDIVDTVLVLGSLGVIGVNLWAILAVILGRSGGRGLLYAYLAVLAITGAATFLTTFCYEYFLNENTRFCGWPVPVMVFQRDKADAPWLDFVGPTVVLAYPANLGIFMFIPSAVFLVLVYRRNLRLN